MVQRKAPSKLGIQAEAAERHVIIPQKQRLANLKANSYQHLQDGSRNDNRGPEMKKKMMKKSRSIKLFDIESLRSSTLKKTISQPGKPPPPLPPPLNVPAAKAGTATPQKQQPAMRTADGSPNYMKSTSSSEARKETSQVSSRNALTGSDTKNARRRNSSNSKASSGSSSKLARSLTRSSSLKRVRTLTKTPSFKHVRAASKKCSRVVICADMNAQRSTCSSTLKDTNFPAYLSLSPGATEAEGTSAMKVCPYTYCSLNGHHHTPLPPLKSFLSARRRMLKTQKSMKLEALSLHRVKPVEIDAGQVIFVDKPAYKEDDFNGSPRSPLIKEGGMEFFVEIYAKNKEGKGKAESPLRGCDAAEVEHNDDKQVSTTLSDGSPHSEIDFNKNLEQYSDIISIGVDTTKGFPEKQKLEDEAVQESFYNSSDFEDDCSASTEGNGSISEVTDMEWEEGQFSTLETDSATNYSIKSDHESDLDDGDISEINSHDFHEPVIKSEDIVHGDILAEEEFKEESASFDTQDKDSDSEMDYRQQNLEIAGFSQMSDSSSHDQQLSIEQVETDLTGVMVVSATVEPSLELIASGEEIQEKNRVPEAENEIRETGSKLGDVEMYYNLEATEEILGLQNQISDAFQNLDKTDQAVTNEAYGGSQDFEDRKTDTNVASCEVDVEQELSNIEAAVQPEEKEQVTVIKISVGFQFPEIDDQMEEEEQVAVTKISVGIQVPDFSDNFYEEDQDDAQEDVNGHQEMTTVACQLEDFAEDINSSQDIADETLPDENQEHSSEDQNGNVNAADYQNLLEQDEDKKFKIHSSMDSDEQSDSGKNKISLAEADTGEVEKMEVEESNQQDTAESFLVESKSNPELPITCSNLKWKVGSKRTINDEEELRKFNPRDPNYLPEIPDPDPEKVDLKHQMMDERKNSDEWMVDYALRQTVTKLGPARKRKVALLVEAFETIMPIPKYESHLKHPSASFAPARPIQACS